MPELDRTRKATLKAVERVKAVRERFKKIVPSGPSAVQMTPDELKRAIERTSPANRERLLADLGYESVIRMLGYGS